MTETTKPLVTEEELDVTIVERPDRHLKVSVTWRELLDDDVLGDAVKTEVMRFPVRGSLPVATMTTFLRLETRINEALAAEDEEADRELEKTLEAAHDRIVALVAEKSLHAFRPTDLEIDNGNGETRTVRAKPLLEMGVDQILVILAWLAGDTSVADAVARALTAGKTGAVEPSADELEADAAAGPEAAASAPLP